MTCLGRLPRESLFSLSKKKKKLDSTAWVLKFASKINLKTSG